MCHLGTGVNVPMMGMTSHMRKLQLDPGGSMNGRSNAPNGRVHGGGPDPSMSDILLGILVAVVVSLVIYGAFRARNAYICKQREDSDNNNVNQNN